MDHHDYTCSHWSATEKHCTEYTTPEDQTVKRHYAKGFLSCLDGTGAIPNFINFRCKSFDLNPQFVANHIGRFVREKNLTKIDHVILSKICGGFDIWIIVSKRECLLDLTISEMMCELIGQHDIAFDSLVQTSDEVNIDNLKADGWVVIYERQSMA